VQHADAHGLAGAVREPFGVHERARPQFVEVEVGVAQVQQAGAELVLVRVAVLLDESVRRQRLEQAVDGRSREAELVGDLADPEPPRTAPEDLQDARRAVDVWIVARRLDVPLAFGIVESASIVTMPLRDRVGM